MLQPLCFANTDKSSRHLHMSEVFAIFNRENKNQSMLFTEHYMVYFLKTKNDPFPIVNEAYEVEIAGTFLEGPSDLALVSSTLHTCVFFTLNYERNV